MPRYIIKRILSMIPVFLILTFAVFILSDYAPGNAVDLIASENKMTEEAYQSMIHAYGLDQPLLLRYVNWLLDLFQGDMGVSVRAKMPVMQMIGNRIGPSLFLMVTGLVLSVLIAIPLGVAAAFKPYSFWDNCSSTLAFIGNAMPSFFLGLCVLYIFSAKLGIFPGYGMYTAGTEGSLEDLLYHLVMPAFVVAFTLLGDLVKQTRGGLLEVLNEDYVKTARAKGLSEKVVIIKHALRNSLIPIVTVISLNIPYIVGGAVVIEQIFGWPGIGTLMVQSINARDFSVVMGITTMICVVVMCCNIILDIFYGVLDPRISRSK